MENHELTREVALVQKPQGGMQPEAAIECQRTVGDARRDYRELPMQSCISRVGVRRHRGETIQRSAQDHHHEARGAAGVRKQHIGQRHARRQGCAAQQETAPSGSHGIWVHTLSPLKLRTHQQQSQALGGGGGAP